MAARERQGREWIREFDSWLLRPRSPTGDIASTCVPMHVRVSASVLLPAYPCMCVAHVCMCTSHCCICAHLCLLCQRPWRTRPKFGASQTLQSEAQGQFSGPSAEDQLFHRWFPCIDCLLTAVTAFSRALTAISVVGIGIEYEVVVTRGSLFRFVKPRDGLTEYTKACATNYVSTGGVCHCCLSHFCRFAALYAAPSINLSLCCLTIQLQFPRLPCLHCRLAIHERSERNRISQKTHNECGTRRVLFSG